jgi:murein L,D-transpeptidase YcbB/YkuD
LLVHDGETGWARRSVATVLVSVAVTGCGGDLPPPLEARLRNAFVESGPGGIAADEVQRALVRELRGVRENAFPTRATLSDFYRKRGNRLVWSEEAGRIGPPARVLLATLKKAPEHGLDPADYALDQLERRAGEAGDRRLVSPQDLVDFDVLATAAFFRYASDVSTGRVHPDEVRPGWHTTPSEIDFVEVLEHALAEGDPAARLEQLPPPHPGYARLREALRALREIEEAGGWPAVPEGPKLAAGSRGPRVASLRRRLAESDSDRFDAALGEAVRRFQEAHGIEPDGVVGARTIAELNVPVGRRIRQVELNLERWRWIPRQLGDPYVMVNVPGFELELVSDRSVAMRSRIVVGKAYTPTPVFSDRIVGVLVNPPWNVPESIAVGEYLVELRKDPRALERQGLRLLEVEGGETRDVDPATVDWSRVDEKKFPYRIRQDPGPDNALGRLKFELTNEFHVYLHDTPATHLFGRSERGLSHGCIRVERPVELARAIPSTGRRGSTRAVG